MLSLLGKSCLPDQTSEGLGPAFPPASAVVAGGDSEAMAQRLLEVSGSCDLP